MAESSLDPFIQYARQEHRQAMATTRGQMASDQIYWHAKAKAEADAAAIALAGTLPETILGTDEAQLCHDFIKRMGQRRFKGSEKIFPDIATERRLSSSKTRGLLAVVTGERHPHVPKHWKGYIIGEMYNPEFPPSKRRSIIDVPNPPQPSRPYTDNRVFLCSDATIRDQNGLGLPEGFLVETGRYRYYKTQTDTIDSGGSGGAYDVTGQVYVWGSMSAGEVLGTIIVENGAD